MATMETKKKQPGAPVGRGSSMSNADASRPIEPFSEDRSGLDAGSQAAASDRRPSDGGMGDLKDAVRHKASEQIETQRDRAANTMDALVEAARSATHGLRGSGQPQLADYIGRAADGIEDWSARLREQNVGDTLRDVQAFARRNPAVFLGAAFGAGILAARFFKSSNPAGATSARRK